MYNRFIKKDGEVLLDLTTDSISASDLLEGVTAHDKSGEKVTGTFTLDNELTAQDSLIAQIQTALENKATPSGEDVTSETNAYTNKLATLETAITALETELQGKASGGSGGGSSSGFCTITITSDYNSFANVFYCGENGWTVGDVNNTASDSRDWHDITVACNSILVVYQNGFYSASVSHGELLHTSIGIGLVYQVPNTPDVEVSISIVTE